MKNLKTRLLKANRLGCLRYKKSMKQERQNKRNCQHNISDLVKKFHKVVSEGPVYICTCCDQLWYKHSVQCSDRLRLTNTNMVTHLQGIISVNGKEWICQSCNEYLRKNKVPPCAVTNGMKFPQKPVFF